MTPRTRAELALLCSEMGIYDAIEIGTHQGVSAFDFLELWSPEGHLTCVDDWASESVGPNPTFLPAFVNKGLGRGFDESLAKLVLTTAYPDRVKFIKEDSVAAAGLFEDGTWPFVYIDGGHSIPQVRADIEAWWPKVKPGGILAGHDYAHSGHAVHDPSIVGVRVVVDHFALHNNLDLKLTQEELPSWYFIKP